MAKSFYQADEARPRFITVIMVLLAVPNLFAGAWAVVDPEGWFDNFPGWAPALVAAFPPYSEHLAVDAGAGLFASGLVMMLAVFWRTREMAIMASVAYLAFALPHAVYHVLNPSDSLSAGEDFQSTATLVLAVVGAAWVLMWQWRRVSTAQVDS